MIIEKKVCTWAVGYGYTPDSKLLHFLGCKRRQCQDCGWYWAAKWRTLLKFKRGQDTTKGIDINRALSLTTAYDPGYHKVWLAFKFFWRFVRAEYPIIQYWGVTEYNQKHTQPHFHFILSDSKFMDYDFLQECWKKAQTWAGFDKDKIAWNIRIEEIKKGNELEKYFTKYLTKLTGGKDEIPRPENWQGRYVRYSRKFFGSGISTKDILQAINLKNNINNKFVLSRVYYDIFPKWGVHSAMGQGEFIEGVNRQEYRAYENDCKMMKIVDNYGVIDSLGNLEYYQTSF
jgi:hypothetical protein